MYEKYKLTKDDIFTHKNFTIITRSGIERIRDTECIEIKYSIENIETFPYFREVEKERHGVTVKVVEATLATHVTVKASGSFMGVDMETFASASPMNTESKHYVEVAEKRAMSRLVLKLVNLYREGVFGEDEGVQNEPA